MTQQYTHSITKEAISELPLEEFTGRIIVIDTLRDVEKAVGYLSEFQSVGFDTETRPSFKKGQRYKISLMQISTDEACFLFRLNRIGIPEALEEFLANEKVLKIGLSLRDDFGAMRKRTDIQPANFLDLQNYVGQFGIEDASLQKIYAILFNKKISKGQRLSNWEADVLSDAQKKYAALDAWACLKIYNQMKQILMKECKVFLKPKKEESLLRFHPWVFSGAIQTIEGEPEEGDLVEVYGTNGRFLGIGHYQIGSIAVRILSFKPVTIDAAFWEERIRIAYTLRQTLELAGVENNNTYRLVHGEGDNLPGLIIDVYDHTAVMQAHSAGMHVYRMEIAEALSEVMGDVVQNIYYKSETTLPFKADLEPENGFIKGGSPENIAMEYGLKFHVDWLKGQKTGFFVDQRENRHLLERYSKGRNVLNMFCYTGGFSFYAMRGGANLVHSVDSSAKAIDLTNMNVELNFPGDSRHQAYAEDAFKYLDRMGDQYDLIILDPPAFAKHKDALRNALRGYTKLNAKAFEKIKPGGFLFTFSCSQVVDKMNFRNAVFTAAAQSGRSVRILHQLTQPGDHPVNIYHPEGEYLKGLVLYVE